MKQQERHSRHVVAIPTPYVSITNVQRRSLQYDGRGFEAKMLND